MKTVHIFFGEMGCGKSFNGLRYAKKNNFKFFEGDSILTQEILDRVSNFKPINHEMIARYMDVLCDAIGDQMEVCDNLVVSQAFYSNKDRESLINFLECLGYQVTMWWVKTSFLSNIQNLLTRDNSWKWVVYWLINKPFFQSPKHDFKFFKEETI